VKKSDQERRAEAREVCARLLAEYKTVSLATCDTDGVPQVSYTPVAIDAEHNIYIFVSELSEHTSNLFKRPRASLMLIEDESRTKQLFARNRLTLEGRVAPIARDHQEWAKAADVYRARFGKFFDQLAQLRDFHMFVVKPEKARIVIGFGAAFEIAIPDWNRLELITGK